ncbi:MAG TPA: DsbC family protein [Wenzhouxiangellaceae bacterium]|nr:DsbC family protein [Wenzhouxiangellaceae bacterium]
MNRILKCMVSALLLTPVLATADDYDQVRERLSSLVNGETNISIAESPLPGILQVRLGSDIVYMTDDGRYLLQGRVLDLDTREDITDRAKSKIRQELIDGIDYEKLISYGPEDSEFEIIVFTDVDCGYCRRLHQQVEEYNDAGIRISYAAFPRAGVGSETFRKMTSVWCSDDQQAAMDLAKGGGTPKPAECDAPVSEQYQLGQSVGVTGTPALITPGGDLIPGYVPPNDLRVRLEQLAAKEDTAAPQDAEAE